MALRKQATGYTTGLKATQRSAIERIFRRTIPVDQVITGELARFMAEISHEIRRQIGVIVDRRGRVVHVVVGDARKLTLPDMGRQRAGESRFRGLRLIHTHIGGEPLSRDDLTDLSLLHLDLVAVIQVPKAGTGDGARDLTIEWAHLIVPGGGGEPWRLQAARPIGDGGASTHVDFARFIADLEAQFAAHRRTQVGGDEEVRAIAIHATTGAAGEVDAETSLTELHELARTASVVIVETIVQRRKKLDGRYVIGRGKLDELVLASMHQGADLIIFDHELTPSQAHNIALITEAKVIDRTQLILDIFARRASTADGKLQVELAQLEYTLPRLTGRNTAMSRLAGGIGGRGPGETQLEIDRRRAKDRISLLRRRIDKLSIQRAGRRRRRLRAGALMAAIVGYTNAGKSTLLNALTGADVLAEDKLFATLDPTARRLHLPDGTARGLEWVLSDTVGFIRDLPEDLVAAFKGTLEELRDAELLIHVVDISTPGWDGRMAAVERVLDELGVADTARVVVFNKIDRAAPGAPFAQSVARHDALPLSALDPRTFGPLRERLVTIAHRLDPPKDPRYPQPSEAPVRH